MTKSQEENVFKITIDNEDSDDLLNNGIIHEEDDPIIVELRKWDKLRRLNNLSPRSKQILEVKKILMVFKDEFPELLV